ncbi:hypothetical protein [Flammeovirga kamogawensis]|uniref:Uncharacterized protein n=2 Tax=Flammeovirga kamogawensis TaxID=373891 RepID=A0ABX8GQM0_9BACT|nr:hypothetical protein [Flammeovirga kamogawensis]MBB6463078.1 hypothetical protein [Flammeovirga kamogawensis]QWG05714.1 hypothetical protein KM029_09990 [Flammeovirga kamogawensis]TRX67542.1 hypothetical protein EO216_05020 [Flammeovirga kamogawensis]
MILLFLSISMFFLSCNETKEDEMTPSIDNENIEVGDGSIFNQSKFKTSFEQSFMSDSRFHLDYTNEIVGGEIISTDLNYKNYGSFGDKIMTFTHTYNLNGVITSSIRENFEHSESNPLNLEFTYNSNGYIETITEIKNNEIKDIITQKYNQNGQLISKKHDAKYDEYARLEEFTYNSKGQVTKLYTTRYNPTTSEVTYKEDTYSFIGENMVKTEIRYNGMDNHYAKEYSYDNDGRILTLKFYVNNELVNNYSFKYKENIFTETYYNSYDQKVQRITVSENSIYNEKYHITYRYDFKREHINYVLKSFKGSNGKIEFKEIYYGTADNLELVGKSQIIEYHNPSLQKTKEKVMSPNGNTLYYIEFEIIKNEDYGNYSINSRSFYDTYGNNVNESEINEEWVLQLALESILSQN